MVGNHDGYSDDPEYGFAEETDEDGLETGRFVTSQENFDWRENIVSNMYVDLENYTDVIHQALDEDLAKAQEDNNKPRKGL